MKQRTITIDAWSVCQDGPQHTFICSVFGTEAAADDYVSWLIRHDIAEFKNATANRIRALLDEGKVGLAFGYWRRYFQRHSSAIFWYRHMVAIPVETLRKLLR